MSFSKFPKSSSDGWSIQWEGKLFQRGIVLSKKEWWKGFLLARIGKILCWWLFLVWVIINCKVYSFSRILTSPWWICSLYINLIWFNVAPYLTLDPWVFSCCKPVATVNNNHQATRSTPPWAPILAMHTQYLFSQVMPP